MKHFVLTLSFLLVTATMMAERFTIDELTYETTSDTTVAIVDADDSVVSVEISSSVTHDGTTYSVTEIGREAFADSHMLEYLDIPSGVTTIANVAFMDCIQLSTINLPSSVDSLGNRVFWGCISLETVTIPRGATKLGEGIFDGCWSLSSVTIEADLTVIPRSMFEGCEMLSSIEIPSTVTRINPQAFMNCSSLTTIDIPDNVTSIGYSAFEGCSSLASVIIGRGVKQLEDYMFDYCYSLTSVVWNARDCDDFSLLESPFAGIREQITSFTLGDGVEYIPASLCEQMTSLESVTIPSGVKRIGNRAFYECSSLKDITIADSIIEIQEYAFAATKYYLNPFNWLGGALYIGNYLIEAPVVVLGKFQVKDGTLLIANSAFTNTLDMTSVTIPSSVTHIGDMAFYFCSTLQSIEVQALEPPKVGVEAFEAVDRSIPVIVPAQSLEAYRQAEVWKEFTYLHEEGSPTGIDDNTVIRHSNSRKFIQNGSIFIQNKGNVYTIQGACL